MRECIYCLYALLLTRSFKNGGCAGLNSKTDFFMRKQSHWWVMTERRNVSWSGQWQEFNNVDVPLTWGWGVSSFTFGAFTCGSLLLPPGGGACNGCRLALWYAFLVRVALHMFSIWPVVHNYSGTLLLLLLSLLFIMLLVTLREEGNDINKNILSYKCLWLRFQLYLLTFLYLILKT